MMAPVHKCIPDFPNNNLTEHPAIRAFMLGVGIFIKIAVSVPLFAGTYHIDAVSLVISCRTRLLGICKYDTSFVQGTSSMVSDP